MFMFLNNEVLILKYKHRNTYTMFCFRNTILMSLFNLQSLKGLILNQAALFHIIRRKFPLVSNKSGSHTNIL